MTVGPWLTNRVGGPAAFLEVQAPYGPDWLFLGVAGAIVLGPLAAARLRLPGIIGLLAGGLVIGPQGLGVVSATDTTVSALGQLGLLYLMFSAGLELDLALFRRYRRAAVLFGVTTFVLPLGLGFLAGRSLGFSPEASLLLGSIWASHTLVTYPTVRDAGLAGNRAVATAVGATALTDTLALVVLAAVASAETGDAATVTVALSLLIGLALVVAYCLVLLPRVTRWFFTGQTRERPSRYAYLLSAMLSAAVLADVVGIEGIVGAFFAGLGLNRLVPAGSALMDRVEFFGAALFVPVFLVSVGVLIDPSVMVRPSTLGLAAVFCGVVVGGKALAALTTRPLLGFDRGEVGLMFGLTTSQAAATLAATFVGFDIGLFGEQVVNAVLVVILVSLVVAALTTEQMVGRVAPTPVEEIAPGRRVLVVTAREDRLAALARIARQITEADAGMVVPMRAGSVTRADHDRDRTLLGLAGKAFAREGLDAEPVLRLGADGTHSVVAVVAEEETTLVVLDWQAASRYQAALRGGRDDHFVGASSAPVLLAAPSDHPVERVVLGLSRRCCEPVAETSLALAFTVAERLADGGSPVAGLMSDGSTRSDLAPSVAGPADGLAERLLWLPDGAAGPGREPDGDPLAPLGPGDLLVLPGHPEWSGFGPVALRASARRGVSVVVVADQLRWGDPTAAEHGLGMLVGRSNHLPVSWR